MEILTELPIGDPHTDMQSYRETCCKVTSVNSSNFLKTRKYPYCAATLVWRLLKKDNSSSHLMKKDLMKWRIYVESIPRSEEASRARGWIGNTKIGPVLDVKVCLHQERYGIEILIESLFRDGTASWVRNVNGMNKYVTESSETISLENVEHRVTGKPGAKAKPMDRRQSWEISSRLFCSVKSHDQITATLSINSSRR